MSIRRSEPVGVLTEQCGHRMQVDGVWTRCARAAVLCTWHPCSLCPCPPMDGAPSRMDKIAERVPDDVEDYLPGSDPLRGVVVSCDHGYVNPEDCRTCDRAAEWEQADSLHRIATALEKIAELLAKRDS